MSAQAAQARRFYLHVLHGGTLRPDDVAYMVRAIEERDHEIHETRDTMLRYAAMIERNTSNLERMIFETRVRDD